MFYILVLYNFVNWYETARRTNIKLARLTSTTERLSWKAGDFMTTSLPCIRDVYARTCVLTSPKLLSVQIWNFVRLIAPEVSIIRGLMTWQSEIINSKIAFFDREMPFWAWMKASTRLANSKTIFKLVQYLMTLFRTFIKMIFLIT